jgi:dipeptidyl aminopeptidase/acylaminoacyl peptidase
LFIFAAHIIEVIDMQFRILAAALSLSAGFSFAQPAPKTDSASGKRPFTFEDMMALKRVTEPAPSPDGKWVVFAAQDVDLEANTKKSHLWIVPAAGGEARRLNQSPNEEERPRFSPDGRRLIFTSKATDPSQIWMCDFDSTGGTLSGKPHQVTTISTGANGGIWSPDGKNILFISSVYPEAKDDAENKQRAEELKKSKVKAQIFSRLFYRHWNAFYEFKRSHLFVISADASVEAGVPPAGASDSQPTRPPLHHVARDLTPGDHDVPPFSLGGQDMYAISPDSREVAYTSNIDEVEATSTNNEIFIVLISGGAPRKISTSPGSDSTPSYSPDGKYIVWRSQARDGYESDKFSLVTCERMSGQLRDATQHFDRSVGSFTWSPDSKTIFFSAEERGESPLFALILDDEGEPPSKIGGLHADDLIFSNNALYFTRMSISAPNEIWRIDFSKTPEARSPAAVTHMNDALLAQIDMPPLESFTFKGAEDADVQGFMIKPPKFDASKKYPLKFLIHGGPQGQWGNSWTYRWNGELFAANGYVVVMINFHGSTGYGQKFTDSIQGDWGGKPFVDLMKGLDYVEQTYPFIDKNREAALGASYGGYMINWMLGHTDRFKCLVSHDGIFNTESAYGTTEELWFPEWEFKGPPWKNRELYRKWSPHLFADKFKTPTLVVHGQLDYRLDVSEGFQLFTTLQRLNVPSKMLYFPEEGHWVLKPQNSRLWYKTVNDWVDQWTKQSDLAIERVSD